jgi:hypothetical protein
MIKNILIGLLMFVCTNVNAEEILSDSIQAAIGNEVENATQDWQSENEEVGSIWVWSYAENKDSYSFEIKKSVSDSHMIVDASFVCGTEYDESEFYGSCEVEVMKDNKSQEWVAIIDSLDKCSCGVEDF